MAEKIVQMSKLAPFGLKRPSAEDIASLQPPAKNARSAGLWTHETRMFAEKIIYLNKSTTKYVIIGNDPQTFEVTMKICDRVTGSHITISTMNRIYFFMDHIKFLVTGSGEIVGDIKTISSKYSKDQWKFSQQEGFGVIVMHKISLEIFHRSRFCIEHTLMKRADWATKFAAMLQSVKDELKRFSARDQKPAMEEIVYKGFSKRDGDLSHEAAEERLIKYHIAFGLIVNQSYFETLKEYEPIYKNWE